VRLLPLPWLLLVLDAACRWRVLPRAPPQPLMAPPVRAAAARRASRPRLAAAGRASRARRRRSPCLGASTRAGPSAAGVAGTAAAAAAGLRGTAAAAACHGRRQKGERKLKKLPSFF